MSILAVASIVVFLASLVTASPLSARQCEPVGTVEHEYSLGGCKPIIFFYARGSTETLNMVTFVLLDHPNLDRSN